MKAAEEIIISQLKEGREEAYRYLFDNHYAVLCAIATQYVHDDFTAETIVADVFFHIWQIRQTLSIHTSLRSYLAQAVRHACLDHLRQSRLRHELPAQAADDEEDRSYPADYSHPLAHLLDKELETVIDSAVQKLPDECRRVLCMSRYEGKKNAEIAADLGISVNTVKYHLKQAMRLLRGDLRKYLEVLFFVTIAAS